MSNSSQNAVSSASSTVMPIFEIKSARDLAPACTAVVGRYRGSRAKNLPAQDAGLFRFRQSTKQFDDSQRKLFGSPPQIFGAGNRSSHGLLQSPITNRKSQITNTSLLQQLLPDAVQVAANRAVVNRAPDLRHQAANQVAVKMEFQFRLLVRELVKSRLQKFLLFFGQIRGGRDLHLHDPQVRISNIAEGLDDFLQQRHR